jgi:hypothetical protein
MGLTVGHKAPGHVVQILVSERFRLLPGTFIGRHVVGHG